MSETLHTHVTSLRWRLGGCAVLVAGVAALSLVIRPPDHLRLVQVPWLMWLFAGVAALNLLTIMPAFRAMLRAPRRVYAVDADLTALLHAHGRAHLIAALRVLAVAGLGLVLLFLGGERVWTWIFAGVALLGLAPLWPGAARLARHLDIESD